VDTKAYVRYLQSHGIRVLGSSIIGLENHTPENMARVIDHAVGHDTDFHQFMLYTPVPGTPLFEEHRTDGTMLPESEFPLADAHGQYRFNYRHPHIREGQEEEYLIRAFERDFQVNGPSLYRLIRTMLKGWKRYKNHPDARIRGNYRRDGMLLRTTYAGAVWAMRKRFRGTPHLREKLDALLRDLYREFGLGTRIIAAVVGRFVHFTLRREEERQARGWTYEPRPVVERNEAALALTLGPGARAPIPSAAWVTGEPGGEVPCLESGAWPRGRRYPGRRPEEAPESGL